METILASLGTPRAVMRVTMYLRGGRRRAYGEHQGKGTRAGCHPEVLPE